MPVKKKKSNKTSRFLNWLNPTTPTKRLLIFALVFAVIGGAYAAYHSFAYTVSSHSVAAWAENPGEIKLVSGSGVRQFDSHGGLPSTYVWRLERGATARAAIPIYSSVATTRSMQGCVRYRFTANSGTRNQAFIFTDRGSPITFTGITGGYTYLTTCTGNALKSNIPGIFTEQIYNNGPADMYIEWISLVW